MPSLKTNSTAASRMAASLISARVLRRLVNFRVPFDSILRQHRNEFALDQVPLDGGSVTLDDRNLNEFIVQCCSATLQYENGDANNERGLSDGLSSSR